MMKGCEIEARGINYQIQISERTHPFKIWSREEEDGEAINHHGHQVPCNLEVLPTTKGSSSKLRVRQVLKNVSCRAKPWEILAIVGPSGAGKSTLLEIVAGKLTPPSPPTILINRKVVDKSDFRKISGYVTQRDMLFPLLTVRETLMFSARLRLGGSLPPPQLSSRVESLLRELGLWSVADARVGDASGRVRGVSGGERRRVSIGVDVVHDPRVLILDEPTSGLDSTSAMQIVDMLKTMAESRGRTVILSIHQPGSRIVKLFGSVLVLAHGSVLHHGTVDQLSSHLRSLGLQVPLQVNVVEFAIHSIDALQQHKRQETLAEHHQQQQQQQQEQREAQEQPLLLLPKKGEGIDQGRRDRCTLQQLFHQHKIVDEESLAGFDLSYDYPNSRSQEVAILTHRFLKNVFRTKELFACRTIQMLVSGLVLGSIFFDLKDDKVLERVGLFAFILTFLLSCTTEALPIFLQEREILMKETSSGSYRVSSYVVANGLVFLPFLFILAILFSVPLYWLVGLNRSFTAFMYFLLLIWLILYTANSVVVCFSALVPNFIVGNSLISGVMGSFFLFSGYFIRKKAMPSYWVFMHFISLFKYPFESFLVNEFSDPGRCVEHEMGLCVLRGEDLLSEEGLGEESRWRNVVVMVCFILAYRFFSYLILRCRCRCVQKGGLKRALI
ncbi:ABC transporter G family member 5 [Elaeis guineensis]|uniref:ABC transporter G family member 5 n=1 Tax=Elaeis guineensis var. tenera TaxID=51953 RepID=A0A6I9QPR0_ELAGV|nr:ABC transporter G family member 5 [Elaeis guineensis]